CFETFLNSCVILRHSFGGTTRMSLRKLNIFACILGLLAVACFAMPALAQDQQPSKIDIFGGYAWADPGSHGFGTNSMPKGFTAAATYWMNRYAGLTLDSGAHF